MMQRNSLLGVGLCICGVLLFTGILWGVYQTFANEVQRTLDDRLQTVCMLFPAGVDTPCNSTCHVQPCDTLQIGNNSHQLMGVAQDVASAFQNSSTCWMSQLDFNRTCALQEPWTAVQYDATVTRRDECQRTSDLYMKVWIAFIVAFAFLWIYGLCGLYRSMDYENVNDILRQDGDVA
jgi:hypothetical protein